MTKAYENFRTNRTPQNVQAHPDQIPNEAGGFGFDVGKWQRLNRFLVLGTEGGSFYVGEQELTRQNAVNLLACIAEDGNRVVETIRNYSITNRTFRQSPLLFALALASAEGDETTRKHAYSVLSDVARIPTHLFEFVQYRTQFGGWGRGLRRAVANWYLNLSPQNLAYELVKYQSRNRWSNADLLRLSHPTNANESTNNIFKWVLEKEVEGELPNIIQAFEKAKISTKTSEIVQLITDYSLPREAIPTGFLNDKEVWEALLQSMPMTAMIRNLAKMTSVGLLTTGGDATRLVVERLSNQEYLKKSRIHPMALLLAHTTYGSGRGFKGSLTWNPIRQILDATDNAFYLSYGNVQPTGKRICLALDGSGSMDAQVANTNINCRMAGVAQALITLNVEPDAIVYEFGTKIKESAVSPRQRLQDALRTLENMGGTNCSLPMRLLEENKINRDVIVIYTDHETWADGAYGYGHDLRTGHPFEALADYRKHVNANARLITVAMAAIKSSIAKQDDVNFLELVGLDANTPQVISSFTSGDF